MISPAQKLQTNIRTIPTMMMMPPSDIPMAAFLPGCAPDEPGGSGALEAHRVEALDDAVEIGGEEVDHERVEAGPTLGEHLLEGVVGGQRLAVGPVADQGVEDVGDRD